MAAGSNSSVFDVKLSPNGGNAVILSSYFGGAGSYPVQYFSKSTNFTSWSTVESQTSGTYVEMGLSNATKSYVIYTTYSSGAPVAGYLKEVTSLSSVANNTAAGSRVWYSVDLDNWSGANKYILAGTSSGLYRSNDGGVTWTSL